jgi:hypothetical protein|tara:strand:+ start:439 stop:666 length:228 start_codon:yes stop_codon:yes gene_type:complete
MSHAICESNGYGELEKESNDGQYLRSIDDGHYSCGTYYFNLNEYKHKIGQYKWKFVSRKHYETKDGELMYRLLKF